MNLPENKLRKSKYLLKVKLILVDSSLSVNEIKSILSRLNFFFFKLVTLVCRLKIFMKFSQFYINKNKLTVIFNWLFKNQNLINIKKIIAMQITQLHTTSESSETKTRRPLNRRIKTI